MTPGEPMSRHPERGMTWTLALACLLALPLAAAELKPETVAAFDRYVAATEQRIQRELEGGPFLFVDELPEPQRQEQQARLKQGEVLIRKLETSDGGKKLEAPDALVHHWVGLVFIPGATLDRTLAFVQDYDHHQQHYAPEVVRSRLLERQGDHFRIFYRLRKKKVITVVLNTEYDARFVRDSPTRAHSASYSTRIAEVENAGEPGEREKPIGHDGGFMWRLDTWWRFEERDGGVYVQCEAVSLTRDVPTGLGWLIKPFITGIPKESLQFTLGKTREGAHRQASGLR